MEEIELKSPFKSPNNIERRENQFISPINIRTERGEYSDDENEPPAGMFPQRHSMGDGSRVNPFEKDVLAGLQKSFWSPSIMDIKETPPQRFWAIEHLSHLFPKDIENSPTSHQNAFPIDEQTESKAQADINAYFSRGQIVPTPSPMKERVKIMQFSADITRVNKTDIYHHCGLSPKARNGVVGVMGQNNGLVNKKKTKQVMESWTQTTLSFPSILPPHIEELLAHYSLQGSEMCGSSNPTTLYPQRSDTSEYNDTTGGDVDSGKNSSSLNNSIRRRLELSFGDDPDGEDSNGGAPPTMCTVDPFRRNHILSTPPNNPGIQSMDTTTSELELQLLRCEFTPEARGITNVTTPGITPITDDPDEPRFNQTTASTPKRSNGGFTFKRWNSKEGPVSPVASCSSAINMNGIFGMNVDEINVRANGLNDAKTNFLRRPYTESSTSSGKRVSSTSSFDDSQYLMDDSSPPSKLYRRHSDNNR